MEVKYERLLEVVEQAGVPISIANYIFEKTNPEEVVNVEECIEDVNSVCNFGIDSGNTQLFYPSIAYECYRENKSYIDEFAQSVLSEEVRCEWLNTSYLENGNLDYFEHRITKTYVEYCCDKLKNHLSVEMFSNETDDEGDSENGDTHYYQDRMF